MEVQVHYSCYNTNKNTIIFIIEIIEENQKHMQLLCRSCCLGLLQQDDTIQMFVLIVV